MGIEPPIRTASDESLTRGKSPFRPLAAEDSLWESHTSGCYGDPEDDDPWFTGFDELNKHIDSQHSHSVSNSTAPLSCSESSGDVQTNSNTSVSSHSGRAPSRSPNVKVRKSRSPNVKVRKSLSPNVKVRKSFVSPKRSPRRFSGNSSSSSEEFVVLQDKTKEWIASLPLDDGKKPRRHSTSARLKSKESKDGLYYQPSKAALHSAGISQPTKKPQRIRRRNSGGDNYQTPSEHKMRTSVRSFSSEPDSGKRSKSCERHSFKAKKKSSTLSTSYRKKNSKKESDDKDDNPTAFHESWPMPKSKASKERKEIDLSKSPKSPKSPKPERKVEKSKKKKRLSITKSPAVKKRELKEGKCNPLTGDITEVIEFFEDMAAMKTMDDINLPPSPSGRKSGQSFRRRSTSAPRTSKRSKSPADARSNSFHRSSKAENKKVEDVAAAILDPLNRRRQRRGSAPAKALVAVQQYKKSVKAPDLEGQEQTPTATPIVDSTSLEDLSQERVMLDVSELAALEIIRLGKDNSLKLDLFELVNHLKRKQLKNGITIENR